MDLFPRTDSESASLPYNGDLGVLNRPEEEYRNANVYHGVRDADNAVEILDSESVMSRQRRSEVEDQELRKAQNRFIEDSIRMLDGVPKDDFDLTAFADEEREEFREHGSEMGNLFVESGMGYLQVHGSTKLSDQGAYGPMREFCVSVGEEITYHVDSRLAGDGAAFEFSVPKQAVIDYGIEGNVPGALPLEYATAIYHGSDMAEDDVERLRKHPATEKHGLDVRPVEDYHENKDFEM